MRVLVIGIGNDFRRDDAVGLIIARQLRGRLVTDLKVCEASGEGLALLELWRNAERVILIDAISAGRDPGHIHRLEAHRRPLPTHFCWGSTHSFSVAGAIELARTLGRLPPRVIVYGIEGRTFAAGVGLSPEVADAVPRVIEQIIRELLLA